MKIYNYDKDTKEFLDESEAKLDPLETKLQRRECYLIPAYATTIPPVFREGKTPVYEADNWVLVKDYRGQIQVNLETEEESIINYLGELQEGYQLLTDYQKTSTYKQKLFDKAKEKKINEVTIKKNSIFKNGFYFNEEHYDCDNTAQTRVSYKLKLIEHTGEETFTWLDYNYEPIMLTKDEFVQLCSNMFLHIQDIEFKTGKYLEAIEKATSIEELDSIVIDFMEV